MSVEEDDFWFKEMLRDLLGRLTGFTGSWNFWSDLKMVSMLPGILSSDLRGLEVKFVADFEATKQGFLLGFS